MIVFEFGYFTGGDVGSTNLVSLVVVLVVELTVREQLIVWSSDVVTAMQVRFDSVPVQIVDV